MPPRLLRAHLPRAALRKYAHGVARSFCEAQGGRMAQCPEPDCAWFVAAEAAGARDVLCGAGHEFCKRCNFRSRLRDDEPAAKLPAETRRLLVGGHAPASCKEHEDQAAEDKSDAASMALILATTMPCPTCKMPITRSAGCNHMRCYGKLKDGSSCNAYFCVSIAHRPPPTTYHRKPTAPLPIANRPPSPRATHHALRLTPCPPVVKMASICAP